MLPSPGLLRARGTVRREGSFGATHGPLLNVNQRGQKGAPLSLASSLSLSSPGLFAHASHTYPMPERTVAASAILSASNMVVGLSLARVRMVTVEVTTPLWTYRYQE